MKKAADNSGFALAISLILMTLIAIVVVSYLATTQIERATSSVFSNRERAKITADSGLAAAVHLLHETTRYGDYITAMPTPAPASTSAPHRTEIYHPIAAHEFLRTDNAIGEILASRVGPSPSPAQAVDPRPSATPIPAPASTGSFGLADPGFTSANSYDFNQIVRLGTKDDARLVSADNQPAYGQWVQVHNTTGDLIGRYAFFIEDESMKVNVDAAGNNLSAGAHLRVNDLTASPSPKTTAQIQEIYPASVLPSGSNRVNAMSLLTAIGLPGTRLPSSASISLLNEWKTTFPDYAHLVTTFSKADVTTAKGWLRMNLNKVVADAEAGGNGAKVAAAQKISDWIRDAWTGPTPIASLQSDSDQLYNDDRLRLQIAANIVDYIDADKIPTDMGDMVPGTSMSAIPVIGIEKIPYLSGVAVIYQAQSRAVVDPTTDSAKMSMKFRFNFINLFDEPLELNEVIQSIQVKGVPVVTRISTVVFDKHDTTYSIQVKDLTPINGTGFTIPPGTNGTSGSGVRSFESAWVVLDETVKFPSTKNNKPKFRPSDQMTISVLGAANARLDSTAMTWNDTDSTGFLATGAGDFLFDATGAAACTIPGVARQIAAIFVMETTASGGTRQLCDPRFRPMILNDRWRKLGATDMGTAPVDTATLGTRTSGFDWYDDPGNRPLASIRNGPMLSVGELGHIAATEYPWRTLYLQHPERPSNSISAPAISEETTRRMNALDWVLVDLFRTSDEATRSGDININGTFDVAGAHRELDALFANLPIGDPTSGTTAAQTLTDTMGTRLTTDSGSISVASVADRRKVPGSAVNLLDNAPIRPYFQIGQLAPVLSRLLSSSVGSDTSDFKSKVNYSLLRSTPGDTTEYKPNYRSDMYVEQAFREVSNSITTRGNVFRVLYVGQAIRDIPRNGVKNGVVDGSEEITAEYLGEAFVERQAVFAAPVPPNPNPSVQETTDSNYKVIAQRVITE